MYTTPEFSFFVKLWLIFGHSQIGFKKEFFGKMFVAEVVVLQLTFNAVKLGVSRKTSITNIESFTVWKKIIVGETFTILKVNN